MQGSFLKRLIAIVGRAAVALAMWVAAPLEPCESLVECEAVVVSESQTSRIIEPTRLCVRLGQLHYGSHTPGQSPGLTTFNGFSGRQLSPDLLAPIRC
jgi:hypothetical protein